MISDRTRRILELAGNVLSLLAIVFIGERLYSYHGQLDAQQAAALALPVLFFSVVYAASCMLTALAWRGILAGLGPQLDGRQAMHIYGSSQIAKYIPGNVLHLVGRQVRGVACGIPALPLAKSMLWEVALLCVSGGLFGILILPHFLTGMGAGLSIVAYLAVLGIAVLTVSKWRDPGRGRSVLLNSAFLAVSGALFTLLLYRIEPSALADAPTALLIGTAYVVAWLAGFVTPGAPAGLGIRELVVYALLQPVAGDAEILAALIAARIVSVLGDLLFYGAAQLASPKKQLVS